jgi:predicted nuclease of predicted toxin-antitoxin system
MLILADENCDRYLVGRLRGAGHDVQHILELRRGSRDETVLDDCIRTGRILLTFDLDFGLMVERAAEIPPAIVLLRLHPLGPVARADIVVPFFDGLTTDWRGRFYVIEPGCVRERFLERTSSR